MRYSIEAMIKTLSTIAKYDAKRKVLIPEKVPAFVSAEEVEIRVFFITKRATQVLRDEIFNLLKKNWKYNEKKNLTEEEVMEIALEAQQAARKRKKR